MPVGAVGDIKDEGGGGSAECFSGVVLGYGHAHAPQEAAPQDATEATATSGAEDEANAEAVPHDVVSLWVGAVESLLARACAEPCSSHPTIWANSMLLLVAAGGSVYSVAAVATAGAQADSSAVSLILVSTLTLLSVLNLTTLFALVVTKRRNSLVEQCYVVGTAGLLTVLRATYTNGGDLWVLALLLVVMSLGMCHPTLVSAIYVFFVAFTALSTVDDIDDVGMHASDAIDGGGGAGHGWRAWPLLFTRLFAGHAVVYAFRSYDMRSSAVATEEVAASRSSAEVLVSHTAGVLGLLSDLNFSEATKEIQFLSEDQPLLPPLLKLLSALEVMTSYLPDWDAATHNDTATVVSTGIFRGAASPQASASTGPGPGSVGAGVGGSSGAAGGVAGGAVQKESTAVKGLLADGQYYPSFHSRPSLFSLLQEADDTHSRASRPSIVSYSQSTRPSLTQGYASSRPSIRGSFRSFHSMASGRNNTKSGESRRMESMRTIRTIGSEVTTTPRNVSQNSARVGPGGEGGGKRDHIPIVLNLELDRVDTVSDNAATSATNASASPRSGHRKLDCGGAHGQGDGAMQFHLAIGGCGEGQPRHTTVLNSRTGTVMLAEFGDSDDVENAGSIVHEIVATVKECLGSIVEIRCTQVLASWNCARVQDEHADLACHCALALSRHLASLQIQGLQIAVATGLLSYAVFGTTSVRHPVLMGPPVQHVRRLVQLGATLLCPVLATQYTKEASLPQKFALRVVDIVPYDLRRRQGGKEQRYMNVFDLACMQDGATGEGLALFNDAFAYFCNGRYERCVELAQQYLRDHTADVQGQRVCALATAALGGLISFPPSRYCRQYLGWANYEAQCNFALTLPGQSSVGGRGGVSGGGGGSLRPGGRDDKELSVSAMSKRVSEKQIRRAIEEAMTGDGEESDGSTESDIDVERSLPAEIIDSRGQVIYRSSKMLGKGAMGAVWLGVNERGSLTAMKFVPIPKGVVPSSSGFDCFDTETACLTVAGSFSTKTRVELKRVANDPHQSVLQLVREIVLLSSLEHENIVAYKGYGITPEYLTICMECVSGGSLYALLEQFGRLPKMSLAPYTRGILEGLHFLHANDVAHRDLKPANVLVLNEGRCKLADFGAAAVLSSLANKKGARTENTVAGTPYYMAPEAARGNVAIGSDVWSLGITVHQMATGRLPFPKEVQNCSTFQFLRQLMDEQIPVGIEEKTIDKKLHEFLKECLQRDLKKRPDTSQLLRHIWLISEPT